MLANTLVNLANLLDPKKSKSGVLNNDEEAKTEEWVNENHPKFLPEFLKFRKKKMKNYHKKSLKKNVINKLDASNWWTDMADKMKKRVAEHEQKSKRAAFCELARNLSRLPSSSARLTRIFSNFGHVCAITWALTKSICLLKNRESVLFCKILWNFKIINNFNKNLHCLLYSGYFWFFFMWVLFKWVEQPFKKQ